MKFFLAFIIVILCIGCRLLQSTEEIEIQIPNEIPEIFKETDYYWLIKYRSFNGRECSLQLDKEVKNLFVTVERGLTSAFALWGVIEIRNSRNLLVFPAGFIYSFENSFGGPYSFDWGIGFESQLLLTLSTYFDLERLNIQKLFDAISEIAEENNHWIIDDEILIENIISGDFRIYDIRKKRLRTIEILIPEGEWINTNSQCGKFFSHSDILPVEIEVYNGSTFFYNKNGGVLEIDMKNDGFFEYMVY